MSSPSDLSQPFSVCAFARAAPPLIGFGNMLAAGGIAGIVIGIVVGFTVIAVLLTAVILRRRVRACVPGLGVVCL